MALSTEYINTGGGKLYIEAFVNGVLSGDMVYFGITENVGLTAETTYLEHKNTETGITKTDAKVQKEISVGVTFGTAEISTKMLSRAYAGLLTQKSQSEITDEAVSVAGVKGGSFYFVGYFSVTTLVVKDETDATTYVDGTDYTFDKGAGLLNVLDSGSISDGDTLHLTVSASAFEGSIMAALKSTQLQARLTFVSDPLAGKRFIYTIKKVNVSASGNLDLKSEEFSILNFEGAALSDESITDPELSDYFDVQEVGV